MTRSLSIAVALIGTTLGACYPSDGRVDVHVHLQQLGAVRELDVVAVPYDAEGILDSLREQAVAPRPNFDTLEPALEQFVRQTPPEVEELFTEWREARRRIEALTDSLVALGREAPNYREAYGRFRSLYVDLVRQEAGLERAMRNLSADDRELASSAAAAADSLRAWETVALASYDSLVARARSASGRTEQRLKTDDRGQVQATLAPGYWWLMARVPHPDNPFREYFWNVPLRVDGLSSLKIPMSDRNVTLRWRR